MAVTPKIESYRELASSGSVSAAIKRFFSVVNIPLLLVAIMLTVYGLLVVRSATMNSTLFSFNRQLAGVALGVVAMIILWRFDYRKMAAWLAPLLIVSFLLIFLPLFPFIGVTINGARSWVNLFGQQVQPAEPAKILIIVVMATLVSQYRGRINSGKDYLKCLGLLFGLLLAIMTQPDLGTGLVYFAIGLTIFFTGGTNWKWLAITIVAIIIAIILMVYLDQGLDEYFGKDVLLQTYQKNRLLVFMDETLDPTGAGYNLKQAKIAIGSGGLFGKGLYNATQSSLGFLPEAPTDFIFCVLAEELGFMGCLGLIALYAALIATSFWVAFRAEDKFGTLIVMGCIGMWVFQILENIGMACGLMPITGIPLPFVSYGSSFMVTNFMALGMVLSVWAHRSKSEGKVR